MLQRRMPGRLMGSVPLWGGGGLSYYVDATGGNDGNDGRSPGAAWQTVGKVSGFTFLYGDRILFKRGETWTLIAALTVPRDGLTFGAYGFGADPILDGNDIVNCIHVVGKSNIRLENIELTQAFSFGIAVNNSNRIAIVDCDVHDHGNDGVIFNNSYNCYVVGGEFYNGYQRVGGTVVTGIEITDGAHDIILSGVICRNQVAGVGISIHGHDGQTMPYNVTFDNVLCHSNPTHGMYIAKFDDTADTNRNIVIKNSIFRDNTQEGVRIEKGVIADNYPDGITFENCIMKDNTRYAVLAKGDNITFKNCLFHEGRMVRLDSSDKAIFYNCTFYLTTWAGFACLQGVDIDGRGLMEVTVKNSLFASPDAGSYMLSFNAGLPTIADIDYNLHHQTAALLRWKWQNTLYNWANYKTNSGQDDNSQNPADPLFTNPGADDFTLQLGSPAIDAGVDVGLPYLGSAPDLGAFEKE